MADIKEQIKNEIDALWENDLAPSLNEEINNCIMNTLNNLQQGLRNLDKNVNEHVDKLSKDFEEKCAIYLDFLQENKNECINLPYSRTKRIQLYIIDDNPTGIETITQTEEKAASETIYDIYGRKVSTTNRGGLYIKNGKKFLVK